MSSQYYKIVLLQKKQLAEKTWGLWFQKPENFSFHPGQYLRLWLPGTHIDGFDDWRDFTIASSPSDKDLLIVTREGIRLFKQTLLDIPLDSKIAIQAPMGGFYLRSNEKRRQVFLAGGVGVTPFYSMIKHSVESGLDLSITLIASFASLESAFFYAELQVLAKQYKHVQVVFTFTRSNPDQKEGVHSGRISEVLIRQYIDIDTKPVFSIVGSGSMVEDTEDLLQSMGIPEGDVRTESFWGY